MDHIEECGMTEMPNMAPAAPEMDKGNPVTVNVSMNASGKEHVADLLDMMKNAGLSDAAPAGDAMMSPRMDMERLSGIMGEPKDDAEDDKMDLPAVADLDGGEDESYANEMELESQKCHHCSGTGNQMASNEPCPDCGGTGQSTEKNEDAVDEGMEVDEVQAILAKHPEAAAALKQGSDIMDHDDLYGDLYSYFANSGDMPYDTQKARDGDPYEWIHNKLDDLGLLGEEAVATEDMSGEGSYTVKVKGKDMASQEELARLASLSGVAAPQEMETEASGDYENEPDEQYSDLSAVIPDGDDLHKKKKTHPATAGGDNPMAIENIKAALYAALTEKKAKPDFLDVDKDGDKKEPMKKALKDKKTTEGRGKVMAGRGRGKKTKVMAGRGRGK